MYEVVYPLGKRGKQSAVRVPRLDTLAGKTIGELSNYKFGSELTFAVLEKALSKRFPGVKFVTHEKFGDTYGRHESQVINDLPGKLKEYGCDAVISGNGG